MVEVPAATPVTTPVEALIVATPVLTDFQTPPLVVLDKVVVLATQTLVVPVIAAITGKAFTVTVVLTESTQPLPFITV